MSCQVPTFGVIVIRFSYFSASSYSSLPISIDPNLAKNLTYRARDPDRNAAFILTAASTERVF